MAEGSAELGQAVYDFLRQASGNLATLCIQKSEQRKPDGHVPSKETLPVDDHGFGTFTGSGKRCSNASGTSAKNQYFRVDNFSLQITLHVFPSFL
ncbi:hypothetical protein J31TS4_31440 [Paenibacillus sp. J31TS4]|nr:hypothetical protein J31TS4_31440 [Paenibacillus sp. J31TS4]